MLARRITDAVPPDRYRRAVHVAVVRLLMTPGDIPDLDPFQRPAWQRRGACRGEPLGRFFPGRGEDLAPGKAICAGCVVRSDCLGYALADDQLQGIWGGTSDRERARMRRATA